MPTFDPKSLHQAVEASLATSPAEASAPAPPRRGVSKWAQLATLGGHAADAGSTIYALNHGGLEGNPIYGEHPSMGKIAAVKGGSAALQMLLQHVIGKSSPTAANVMGFGTGAALGGVAAHNLSVAKKAK
jgi:hypothetical protein